MKLNRKGQISLDLIFSLLIVVIFITTMIFFVNDFQNSKENINLENNLRKYANLSANFISNCSLMQDSSFESKLLIKKINYKNELITPQIKIDSNSITFEYENKSAKSFFVANSGFNIIKEEEYIVVKNNE